MNAQGVRSNFRSGHTDTGIAQNGRMTKLDIRQVLARNLREAMQKSPTLNTQLALAGRAGISQSHLSEILRGITSATVDLVNDLAFALGVQPMELLADTESARQAALAKMLWGERVENSRVAEHYPMPPVPKKEAAPRRKKSAPGRRRDQPGGNA
jgi:transcriptional regulator with XRE-family HTH domain